MSTVSKFLLIAFRGNACVTIKEVACIDKDFFENSDAYYVGYVKMKVGAGFCNNRITSVKVVFNPYVPCGVSEIKARINVKEIALTVDMSEL
jgi:hypothetical protein